jgi:hypothetical protein
VCLSHKHFYKQESKKGKNKAAHSLTVPHLAFLSWVSPGKLNHHWLKSTSENTISPYSVLCYFWFLSITVGAKFFTPVLRIVTGILWTFNAHVNQINPRIQKG